MVGFRRAGPPCWGGHFGGMSPFFPHALVSFPKPSRKIINSNTTAEEYLLERLRILLNRLQAATEILYKWPEADGDSAKIHNETATE
jgi:hypothetical protein